MKATLETVQTLFPDAVEKRGQVWARDNTVDRILDGIALSFTRRRYSNQTFTWVQAYLGGQWVELGDPWPCVTPSAKDLREAIARRS